MPQDPFGQPGAFSGPGTMFSGAPIGAAPDMNVAGMFGMTGPEGMAINMALAPLLGQVVGNRYVPAQFSPTANLYSQFREKSAMAMQRSAMTQAAEVDRQTYFRMIQGAANLAGTRFGPTEQRAATELSADISRIMPMLAPLAPDTFDKLHGARGSAVIFAQQMAAAGRYAIDPITGSRGLSGDTIAETTRRTYDRLYGPEANIREMRGVSAGQAGRMYDEMTRRGLVGGPDRAQALSGIAAGMPGKTIDEIVKLPDFDNRLRTFEADRTVAKLKDMSKAVAAMRDVFGDAGRPDAPMSELINALNALTQGGLQTMDAGKIEQTVRTAANVARNAGTSVTALMALTASAARQSDALGLDRSTAVRAGIGGIAFADAYGRFAGGARGFGLMDKERAAIVGAQLEVNAAASPMANQLAAVVRLGDEFQAFAKDPATDAARLYQALKSGQSEFVDAAGKRRSVFFPTGSGPGSLTEMLGNSGVESGLFQRVRGQVSANQPFIDQVSGIVRQGQGEVDIAPKIAQEFTATLRQVAAPAGVDATRFRAALDVASGQAAKGLLDLSPSEYEALAKGDTTPVSRRLLESLKSQGIPIDEDLRRRVVQGAQLAVGNAKERFATDPGTRGYGGLINAIGMNNKTALAEAGRAREEARLEGVLQSEFAKLGTSGPLARLSDILQGAGPATSIESVLAEAFGFVDKGDLEGVMAGPLGKIRDEMTAFQKFDPEMAKVRAADLLKQRAAAIAVGGPAGTAAVDAQIKELEKQIGLPIERISGMSSRDVRLGAMRTTVGRVQQYMPAMQEVLGRATGGPVSVTARDVNAAYQAAQTSRRTAADEAISLAEQFMADEGAMGRFGEGGLDVASGLQVSGKNLKDLADRYAGGDVEALLAGRTSATARKDVSAEDRGRIGRIRGDLDAADVRGRTAEGGLAGLAKDRTGGNVVALFSELEATDAEKREAAVHVKTRDGIRAEIEALEKSKVGATAEQQVAIDAKIAAKRKEEDAASSRLGQLAGKSGVDVSRLTGGKTGSKLSAAEQMRVRGFRQDLAAASAGRASATASLLDVASRYGGDIAGIMGQDDAEAKTLLSFLAGGMIEDIKGRETELGIGIAKNRDQRGGWSPEYRERVDRVRKDLRTSTPEALQELFKISGGSALDSNFSAGERAKLLAGLGGSDTLQRALPGVRRLRELTLARMSEADRKDPTKVREAMLKSLQDPSSMGREGIETVKGIGEGVAGLLKSGLSGQAVRSDIALEKFKPAAEAKLGEKELKFPATMAITGAVTLKDDRKAYVDIRPVGTVGHQ